MGTTIASDANKNICLAPSDSASETAAQVTHFTDSSQPQAARDLWTGATYSALNVPLGERYGEYQLVGGAIVKRSTQPTVESLKIAARRFHEYLASLAERLEGEEARLWLSSAVAKGHDWIAELHYGTNIVVAKRTSALSTLTIAQRLAFLQQLMLGPADVRDLHPINQIPERIHRIYQILSRTSPVHTAPSSPVTYIDPRGTPAPVTLDNAVALSATLGLNTITDFTNPHGVDIDGSWIDNLTE